MEGWFQPSPAPRIGPQPPSRVDAADNLWPT